jgi:hypothetical protein
MASLHFSSPWIPCTEESPRLAWVGPKVEIHVVFLRGLLTYADAHMPKHTHLSTYAHLTPVAPRTELTGKSEYTRAYTHLYKCTHAHSAPVSVFEELSWTGKSVKSQDWWSHHKRLVVDGHVAYYWKNSAVKSCNKFRKIRAPVSGQRLELVWVCSTIRNPTHSSPWFLFSLHRKNISKKSTLNELYICIEKVFEIQC